MEKSNMINIDILKNSESGEIIATGYMIDSQNTNMNNTGNKVKWVAVRGVIGDFAIYIENVFSNESEYYPNLGEWSDKMISEIGDKIPNYFVPYLIKDIDKKTLEQYRG